MEKTPVPTVYQLKVSLRWISPMIWRRFLVTGDMTLYQLHRMIQISFGWEDFHLHSFQLHGCLYHTERTGQRHRDDNGQEITLAVLQLRTRQKIIYEYDFGDSWIHEVRIEATPEFDPEKFYPACIGGARSGPPEDIGGAPGYLEFLDQLAMGEIDIIYDNEILENFEPEEFGRREINSELKEEWRRGSA